MIIFNVSTLPTMQVKTLKHYSMLWYSSKHKWCNQVLTPVI